MVCVALSVVAGSAVAGGNEKKENRSNRCTVAKEKTLQQTYREMYRRSSRRAVQTDLGPRSVRILNYYER